MTMGEKGDQGLAETPPSSSDEAPSNLGSGRQRPHVVTVREQDEESDDDRSASDRDAQSQGTEDTKVPDKLAVVGQATYDDTRDIELRSGVVLSDEHPIPSHSRT